MQEDLKNKSHMNLTAILPPFLRMSVMNEVRKVPQNAHVMIVSWASPTFWQKLRYSI